MRKIFFVFLASVFVSGCATLVNSPKQNVAITSSPQAATIEVKNPYGMVIFSGQTPTKVKLARKDDYTVTAKLPGYKEQSIAITKSFDAITSCGGNLICGGLFGLIVDAVSGSMYKLEPDSIHFSLVTASYRDKKRETYLVFNAMGSDRKLRTFVVPMIKG